jgi:hypothetical protein
MTRIRTERIRPGGTAEGSTILGAATLLDSGTLSGVPSGTPTLCTHDPVVAVASAPSTTGYHPASLRDELRLRSHQTVGHFAATP